MISAPPSTVGRPVDIRLKHVSWIQLYSGTAMSCCSSIVLLFYRPASWGRGRGRSRLMLPNATQPLGNYGRSA